MQVLKLGIPKGSLEEATAVLGKIGRPGDVVLFENDLPDNYNEDQ